MVTLCNVKHILFSCFGGFLLLSFVIIQGSTFSYHVLRLACCCGCRLGEWSIFPDSAKKGTGWSLFPDGTSYEDTHPIMFHWWKLLYESLERSWVRETSKWLQSVFGWTNREKRKVARKTQNQQTARPGLTTLENSKLKDAELVFSGQENSMEDAPQGQSATEPADDFNGVQRVEDAV